MGMEPVDRQALLDAGLDPDDPQVWATQRRISDLLVCLAITQLGSAEAERVALVMPRRSQTRIATRPAPGCGLPDVEVEQAP